LIGTKNGGRIALADAPLLGFDENQVQLDYQDHRDGNRQEVLTRSGDEFIRRFLLHVLPKGYLRIRLRLSRQPLPPTS
jgi:hypothetical protein